MKKFYSFNDTKIKFKKDTVEKTYILRAINQKEKELVSKLIEEYFETLKSTRISLPKLIKYKDLNFIYEFCGESLIDSLKEDNISSDFMDNVIEQIGEMLHKCKLKEVGMDPHIKNFTYKKDKVFYVDTFPPVTEEYIELLTKYNKENKENIKKHLDTWKPDRLMYHFLADIKKTNDLNKKFFNKCKSFFIKKKYIKNFDMKEVDKIIEIEEKNLNKKGFTLS